MSSSSPPHKRGRRWLRRFCRLTAVLLLLLVLLVAALPTLLSTAPVRQRLLALASAQLQVPVTAQVVRLSWFDGLALEGVTVGSPAPFAGTPLLQLQQLVVSPLYPWFGQWRTGVELTLQGVTLDLKKDATGRSNLPPMVTTSASAAAEPVVPAVGEKPAAPPRLPDPSTWRIKLPIDLAVKVALSDIVLRSDDAESGQSVAIDPFSCFVDLPSLAHEPLALRLAAHLETAGSSLGDVALKVGVADLVQDEVIVVENGHFDLGLTAPGLDLALEGRLRDDGVKGHLELLPGELLTQLAPLLPTDLPRLQGALRSQFAAGWQGQNVEVSLALQGEQLAAAGGPLASKQAGPLDLALTQQVQADLEAAQATLHTGSLTVGAGSRIAWQGEAAQIFTTPELDFHLGPVDLDLAELLALAAPFMPPELQVALPDSHLRLEGVDYLGGIDGKTGEIALSQFALVLPQLDLTHGELKLQGEALTVGLARAEVTLQGEELTPLTLNGTVGLGRLALAGATPLMLEALELPWSLKGAIRPNPQALYGVEGGVTLGQSLSLSSATLPQAVVERLEQSLDLVLSLPPRRELLLEPLSLTVKSAFHLTEPQPLSSDVDLTLSLPTLRLYGEAAPKVDLDDLQLQLRLGEALQFKQGLSLKALGEKGVQADGGMSLDVAALAALGEAFLPPGLSVAGTVASDWSLTAQLPPLDQLGSTPPLELAPALRALTLTTTLDALAVTLDQGEAGSLRLSGLHTGTPLTLRSRNGVDELAVNGSILLGALEEAPGLGALAPPLGLDLEFESRLEQLDRLQVAEQLKLSPLVFSQSFELSLENLGPFLRGEEPIDAAKLLRRLDATLFAGVDTKLDENLPPVAPELTLRGSMSSGCRVDLHGGERLDLHGFFQADRFDVTFGEQLQLQNLGADLDIAKSLRLTPLETAQGAKAGASYLSESLLATPPLPLEGALANDLQQRVGADLRARYGRHRSLSFDSVQLKGAPVPLEVAAGEFELLIHRSLPHLEFFRLDLIGGTIQGEMLLEPAADLRQLQLRGDVAFTGLDTARLLPPDVAVETGRASEIDGALKLRLPLTQDVRQLLETLNLDLDLRHVGRRTLERLLYALDPYESNEAVVMQRRLLSLGGLNWLRVVGDDGQLSVDGEVQAVGAAIRLPRIERLRLAELPIEAQLEEPLAQLGPVLEGVSLLRSEELILHPDGRVTPAPFAPQGDKP